MKRKNIIKILAAAIICMLLLAACQDSTAGETSSQQIKQTTESQTATQKETTSKQASTKETVTEKTTAAQSHSTEDSGQEAGTGLQETETEKATDSQKVTEQQTRKQTEQETEKATERTTQKQEEDEVPTGQDGWWCKYGPYHEYDDSKTITCEATCTTPETCYFTCSVCGETVCQTFGEPLGHNWQRICNYYVYIRETHYYCNACGMDITTEADDAAHDATGCDCIIGHSGQVIVGTECVGNTLDLDGPVQCDYSEPTGSFYCTRCGEVVDYDPR